MTEQDLTQKIIQNAEIQAASLVAAAEKQAQEKLNAAKKAADARQAEALQKAEAKLHEQETQQQRAHEVAKIKAQINAQQQAIDQAFEQARTKLVKATAKEIKTIVGNFTKKYAKKGDKIYIAKAWAKAMPELPTTTAIDSGIIIENATYRMELSVDAVLAELRDGLAPQVAELLGVL